tara:strand:+ start:92 stop:1204 length:1113 start_codon:yes stop_codon:yes gene_type:complete
LKKRIFITGGAGFIGSHLVQKILDSENYNVTIYDNLSSQVHLDFYSTDFYNNIKNKVNFVFGDITDLKLLRKSVRGHDIIFHLASETGTGQSMYEKDKYIDVNVNGTLNLVKTAYDHSIEKIILSSSRAVYGEGKYFHKDFGNIYPEGRSFSAIKEQGFELKFNNNNIKAVPTDENSLTKPTSVYGLTKSIQEDIIKASKIPYVILRYQNVYGPGQSLSNPYTGIISVFANRIYNNNKILIFEDGKQTRDFIFIDDVSNINFLVMENQLAVNKVFNIGTGNPVKVYDLFKLILKIMKGEKNVKITNKYRLGDIRHNFADTRKLKRIFKYDQSINLEKGLTNFICWFQNQKIPKNNFEKSMQELIKKGLYR